MKKKSGINILLSIQLMALTFTTVLAQEKVIPLLLNGDKDIIGQAQTGTGKTAAFGLPLIEMIQASEKTVKAIVLTPTRELAIQVAEEMASFKGRKKLKIYEIQAFSNLTCIHSDPQRLFSQSYL